MRYALLSDIHSNLQALQAVLLDIKALQVDDIICLGDIIGYGPQPAECLALAYEKIRYFVLGNHDAVLASKMDTTYFSGAACEAMEWTKTQLDQKASKFFEMMPYELSFGGFRCTHGSFSRPELFGYIFDENDALASFYSTGEDLLFVGHTHMPGIYMMSPAVNQGRPVWSEARDFVMEPQTRYLVNVGSVGQPRDEDFRACYVIFDTATRRLSFHRVTYDMEAFNRKVAERGFTSPHSYMDFLSEVMRREDLEAVRKGLDFTVQRAPAAPARKNVLYPVMSGIVFVCLVALGTVLFMPDRIPEPPPDSASFPVDEEHLYTPPPALRPLGERTAPSAVPVTVAARTEQTRETSSAAAETKKLGDKPVLSKTPLYTRIVTKVPETEMPVSPSFSHVYRLPFTVSDPSRKLSATNGLQHWQISYTQGHQTCTVKEGVLTIEASGEAEAVKLASTRLSAPSDCKNIEFVFEIRGNGEIILENTRQRFPITHETFMRIEKKNQFSAQDTQIVLTLKPFAGSKLEIRHAVCTYVLAPPPKFESIDPVDFPDTWFSENAENQETPFIVKGAMLCTRPVRCSGKKAQIDIAAGSKEDVGICIMTPDGKHYRQTKVQSAKFNGNFSFTIPKMNAPYYGYVRLPNRPENQDAAKTVKWLE